MRFGEGLTCISNKGIYYLKRYAGEDDQVFRGYYLLLFSVIGKKEIINELYQNAVDQLLRSSNIFSTQKFKCVNIMYPSNFEKSWLGLSKKRAPLLLCLKRRNYETIIIIFTFIT